MKNSHERLLHSLGIPTDQAQAADAAFLRGLGVMGDDDVTPNTAETAADSAKQ